MKTGSEPMSVKKRCPECDEDYDKDAGDNCPYCGYNDDDDDDEAKFDKDGNCTPY